MTLIQAPYVFPIVGGRKVEHLKRNIDALEIDLSDEEIREIEGAVPFDFGYPHSLISGDPHKTISGSDPCYFIRACAYFEGVGDPKVCNASSRSIESPQGPGDLELMHILGHPSPAMSGIGVTATLSIEMNVIKRIVTPHSKIVPRKNFLLIQRAL